VAHYPAEELCGIHTIRLMRTQLLSLALLLVAPAFAQDPCEQVSILQVQYAAVDSGVIEVVVHNQSNELFDYPSFVLVDDQGDTLARENVNFFGIGPTPQAHYLSMLPGATLPTGPFDATLVLYSAFSENVSCIFNLSGVKLCPPPPCQQAVIYLTNLDVPETFGAYWWIDGDAGTFLYSGDFLMDGITSMGFDTLCLPPGDYVLNFSPFSPIDSTYVVGITSDWNFTIGTNTAQQDDDTPLDLAFSWYAACAEVTNAVAEPTDAGIQLLGGAQPALLFQRAYPAVDLRITDLRGSLVYSQHLAAQAEGARVLLPIGSSPGLYLVSLAGPAGNLVWKVARY